MLQLANLRVSRGDFTAELARMQIAPGQCVALCGVSGSGKSTLLEAIGLLTSAFEVDRFNFAGMELSALTPAQQQALRIKFMGIMPQVGGLLPFLTIEENWKLQIQLALRQNVDFLTEGGAHTSRFVQASSNGSKVKVSSRTKASEHSVSAKPNLIEQSETCELSRANCAASPVQDVPAIVAKAQFGSEHAAVSEAKAEFKSQVVSAQHALLEDESASGHESLQPDKKCSCAEETVSLKSAQNMASSERAADTEGVKCAEGAFEVSEAGHFEDVSNTENVEVSVDAAQAGDTKESENAARVGHVEKSEAAVKTGCAEYVENVENAARALSALVTPQTLSAQDLYARLLPMAERLGLTAHLHKLPEQLSIGQRQRALFIRSIAHFPKLLLIDEPTSSLDPDNAVILFKLIEEIAADTQMGVLIVTHDLKSVASYPQYVYQPERSHAGYAYFRAKEE